MIYSYLIKYIKPKNCILLVLIIALLYTITMWHETSVSLKKAQLVYSNPEINVVEKIVYRQGPVRIITKIKEVPGKTETIIVETRAPIEYEAETSSTSAPVPLAVAMTPVRSDRYLLTLGVNRLTPDFDGKALFVGYGINNRIDIQVGGMEHDGFSPWVMGTLRF